MKHSVGEHTFETLSTRRRPELLLILLLIVMFVSLYIALHEETSPLSDCIHECAIEKTEQEHHACLRGCLRYARIDGKL